MSILSSRIVSVRYADTNREYAYFTDDASIVEGDKVVVVSPHNGPQIVTVSSVKETVGAIEKVREWIVCKIDLAAYNARKEREEKREILRAKIERAKKEALAAIDIADLATRSPELAKLIEEYNSGVSA